MSTTIDKGYQLKLESIAELNEFYRRVRTHLAPIQRRLRLAVGDRVAVMLLDQAVRQDRKAVWLNLVQSEFATQSISVDSHRSLDWVVEEILCDHHQHINRTGYRDPEYDWMMRASILSHPTGTYAILYTDQAEFVQLWESMPEVTSYAYWNQTDTRPDGVSATEWRRRRTVWDDILTGIGVPAEHGIGITLTPEPGRYVAGPHREISQFIDARRHQWAFDAVLASRKDEVDPQNPFHFIFEADRWIRQTDEGREAMARELVLLDQYLPQTWEHHWWAYSLDEIWQSTSSLRQHRKRMVSASQ